MFLATVYNKHAVNWTQSEKQTSPIYRRLYINTRSDWYRDIPSSSHSSRGFWGLSRHRGSIQEVVLVLWLNRTRERETIRKSQMEIFEFHTCRDKWMIIEKENVTIQLLSLVITTVTWRLIIKKKKKMLLCDLLKSPTNISLERRITELEASFKNDQYKLKWLLKV